MCICPAPTFNVASLDGCNADDLISKILRAQIHQNLESFGSSYTVQDPLCTTINSVGELGIRDIAESITRIVRDWNRSVRPLEAFSSSGVNNIRQETCAIVSISAGIAHGRFGSRDVFRLGLAVAIFLGPMKIFNR